MVQALWSSEGCRTPLCMIREWLLGTLASDELGWRTEEVGAWP